MFDFRQGFKIPNQLNRPIDQLVKMKRPIRLLFRLLLFAGLIFAGILTINTISFSSRQLFIEAVEKIPIDEEGIARFAQAIQIPTVSQPSSIDTVAFKKLADFIRKNYPLVDSLLEKESISKYSFVFKWQGKNTKLKPLLLMAHMDVVPVEKNSLDEWSRPPFSGAIEDGFIWGRGTMDDKLGGFGLLEAVSLLLEVDYRPQRTVYLAFGQDEEVGGVNGAKRIAANFKKQGIEFEFILDEGGLVVEDAMPGLGKPLAMIGVAEKGYTTLELTAELKEGGHSSMPPKETAIGLLSNAILTLQNKPFPSKIDGATESLFRYAGPEMSLFFKVLFANLWCTESLLKSRLANIPATSAMIRTTIAPTMLRGGFKENVLPTKATATVNFRIIPGETVASVMDYVRARIDDERVVVSQPEGNFGDNPSEVSSTESFGFQVIQTTIKQLFTDAVVAPSLVIGATDSRHFSKVSANIYRFLPIQIPKEDTKRFHGIDERVSVENFKQAIRFYRQLIINACR